MAKAKSANSDHHSEPHGLSAPPNRGLAELTKLRLPVGVLWPDLGLGVPTPLRWSQAHDSAIQRDGQGAVWHAGHANAVVAYGPAILVGSDTSGVWLINPAFDAVPQQNAFPAEPLSWTWPNPQVAAMCPLTDAPTACFVASSGGPGSPLRLLSLNAVLGGIEHSETTIIPVPWWMWSLSSVLVLRGIRTVVIGGVNGVAFSTIPTDPTDASSYDWHTATGLPPGSVSGLAEGPASSVIAAFYGDGAVSSASRGLFHGSIVPGAPPTLSLAAATLPTDAGMKRTSVATCAADRSVGYAIAADSSDAGVAALMRTADGGASWSLLPVPDGTSNQGFYNNCIDVHPSDSATVAFGWRAGPFVSQNSGASWVDRSDDPMHSDVHGVTFTSTPSGVEMWAVSDGGVFHSTDLGATWDSRWNRHLLNLEFYGGQGTFGVCSVDPSLFAGATQDNGNVYCGPEGLAWTCFREFEGGDGGTTTIFDDRACIHRNNTLTRNDVEFGNHLRRTLWQGLGYADGDGVEVPADGFTDGLPYPVISRVATPTHQVNSRRVLAVAGRDQSVWAYLEPAGDDGLFVKVATLPADKSALTVTAVGSTDGSSVLVGLSDGTIMRAALPGGTLTAETPDGPLPASVTDFDVAHDALPYALLGNGTLARKRAGVWQVVTSLRRSAAGIAVHPSHQEWLYAAADDGVWLSTDSGDTWAPQSEGLPTLAFGRGLSFVRDGNAWRLLLSTYGWGVFATSVTDQRPPQPKVPHLTSAEARILFGIINDGGGIEIVGGRLVRVPPREPARQKALLMGVLALASQLGARGTALQQQVMRLLE